METPDSLFSYPVSIDFRPTIEYVTERPWQNRTDKNVWLVFFLRAISLSLFRASVHSWVALKTSHASTSFCRYEELRSSISEHDPAPCLTFSRIYLLYPRRSRRSSLSVRSISKFDSSCRDRNSTQMAKEYDRPRDW